MVINFQNQEVVIILFDARIRFLFCVCNLTMWDCCFELKDGSFIQNFLPLCGFCNDWLTTKILPFTIIFIYFLSSYSFYFQLNVVWQWLAGTLSVETHQSYCSSHCQERNIANLKMRVFFWNKCNTMVLFIQKNNSQHLSQNASQWLMIKPKYQQPQNFCPFKDDDIIDPIHLSHCFFPLNFIKKLVECTNRYARDNCPKRKQKEE